MKYVGEYPSRKVPGGGVQKPSSAKVALDRVQTDVRELLSQNRSVAYQPLILELGSSRHGVTLLYSSSRFWPCQMRIVNVSMSFFLKLLSRLSQSEMRLLFVLLAAPIAVRASESMIRRRGYELCTHQHTNNIVPHVRVENCGALDDKFGDFVYHICCFWYSFQILTFLRVSKRVL